MPKILGVMICPDCNRKVGFYRKELDEMNFDLTVGRALSHGTFKPKKLCKSSQKLMILIKKPNG